MNLHQPVLTVILKCGLCRWKIIKQKDNLKAIHGNCTTYVVFKPFRMDVLVAGNLAVSVNSRGLLNFEHYRERE